jgi:hypothetical protein
MMEAWLYVVSGMQDVKESERPLRELDVAELADAPSQPVEGAARAIPLSNLFDSVFFGASMSSGRASEGLYVTTQPYLRLALAEKDKG